MRLTLAAIGLSLVTIACAFEPAIADVEVEARLARRTMTVGEVTALEVVVRGAVKQVGEPEFDVPEGIQLLGSGRSQSFSWVNGKSHAQTTFRYELVAEQAGSFTIGPIYVRVPGHAYESPALDLTVMPSSSRVTQRGEGPASLNVDVQPRNPYLGQPIIMRVRLVQRAPLEQDPQYAPPPTPGFWSERASQPESYYADENGARVLVTETRTRLYPLAGGRAEIGEATATLMLADPNGRVDPFRWLSGRASRRIVSVTSQPIVIDVRPLPAGAPAGFNGAVGHLTLSWTTERERTPQDVPVVARLDVRGIGNLPLMRPPSIASRDFEVFASTAEDSLGVPGKVGEGRRRFQWTVLPRRQGDLQLEGPQWVWFDTETQRYRSARPAPLTIVVEPPLAPDAADQTSFPAVFTDRPLDAFARRASPWAFGLAGVLLGAALLLWRRAPRAVSASETAVVRRRWRETLMHVAPDEFWSVADRAARWLEGEGAHDRELSRRIATARYGAEALAIPPVRDRLLELLAGPRLVGPAAWVPRTAALGIAALALALCVQFAPRPGPAVERLRARAADQAAQAEDIDRAEATWLDMWARGGRHASLAARLAWSALRARNVAAASVWALRGDALDPRDPELGWAIRETRESGGLSGFTPARLPVRRMEWALIAFVLGVVGLRRRVRVPLRVAIAALWMVAAVADPFEDWRVAHNDRGIIRVSTSLVGTGLELDAGQVVGILERGAEQVRVGVARDVVGWIPKNALADAKEGS